MKKQLLAGTAIAAASILIAGGAAAQDKKMMKPSISVGGYYQSVVGGILDEDMGADTSSLDVRTDAEIHFNGRATLDDGMSVHARVELEGQNHHSQDKDSGTGGDPIDEYFITLSGAFGSITLGGTGAAPVKMLGGVSGSWATQVGRNLSFYSHEWVPSTHRGNFGTVQHVRVDTGDAEKATYISPKFGGFQVGLSYSPNMKNDDDNTRINAEEETHDGIEGAATFSGKFGGGGFAVGAGGAAYQGKNDGGKDLSAWFVGTRLDFGGGFRLSAAHKRTTNDDETTQGSVTDAGVRYIAGANQFSVTGLYGEMDEGGANYSAVMGSYARTLGPGVKLFTSWTYNESDDGDGSENSGFAGLVGIHVGF